jgi:hypothetical protein
LRRASIKAALMINAVPVISCRPKGLYVNKAAELRHSNDNALVESKNGFVVVKRYGDALR